MGLIYQYYNIKPQLLHVLGLDWLIIKEQLFYTIVGSLMMDY